MEKTINAIKATVIKDGIRIHYSGGSTRDYSLCYFEYDLEQ